MKPTSTWWCLCDKPKKGQSCPDCRMKRPAPVKLTKLPAPGPLEDPPKEAA